MILKNDINADGKMRVPRELLPGQLPGLDVSEPSVETVDVPEISGARVSRVVTEPDGRIVTQYTTLTPQGTAMRRDVSMDPFRDAGLGWQQPVDYDGTGMFM